MQLIWTILDCESTNEVDPTIQTATWKCTASESGKSASMQGVQLLTGLRRAAKIPFAQLTKKQVIAWCFAAGVDRVGIEAQLAAEVTAQLVPATLNGVPPWKGKDADDLTTTR